jgi:hypothetical protein
MSRVAEQSRGELASGRATARAQDVAVQIGRLSTTVSQHARRRPQHLLPATPSHLPIDFADVRSRSDGAMACCRGRGLSRVNTSPDFCSPFDNVTTPCWRPLLIERLALPPDHPNGYNSNARIGVGAAEVQQWVMTPHFCREQHCLYPSGKCWKSVRCLADHRRLTEAPPPAVEKQEHVENSS